MRYVSMNERDKQTIKYINKHYEDLLEEVRLIGNFEEFKKGGVLTKAIKMDILQIAENVNCLTEEATSKLNKKDLRGIIDVRNHIAHGYIYVNDEIVWYVIQDCLPTFINEINNLK